MGNVLPVGKVSTFESSPLPGLEVTPPYLQMLCQSPCTLTIHAKNRERLVTGGSWKQPACLTFWANQAVPWECLLLGIDGFCNVLNACGGSGCLCLLEDHFARQG